MEVLGNLLLRPLSSRARVWLLEAWMLWSFSGRKQLMSSPRVIKVLCLWWVTITCVPLLVSPLPHAISLITCILVCIKEVYASFCPLPHAIIHMSSSPCYYPHIFIPMPGSGLLRKRALIGVETAPTLSQV